MRICPFDGCPTETPPNEWCCIDHWKGMEPALQTCVRHAHREYKEGRLSPAQLRERLNNILAEAGGLKQRRGKP